MRRRYIPDEERDTVVRLRKSGAGWLRIERVTNIPRRTAKHVFEHWQQEEAAVEIKAARRQVAADAFNSHMRDLTALAEIISRTTPEPEPKDRRDSRLVMESVLDMDIRSQNYNESDILLTNKDFGRINRRNRILLESLKQHTRGKVDWQILDLWQAAWDGWKTGMDMLESETSELIHNILNHKTNKSGLIAEIKSNEGLISQMVSGVVQATYCILKISEPHETGEYIKVRQAQNVIAVLFGKDAYKTELIVESEEMAERVLAICKQALDNLHRGKESSVVRDMAKYLANMRQSHSQIADALDELKLTPLILRTKCDICPA